MRAPSIPFTPKQALDIHKEPFFDWLEEQHRKAEAEKARRAAEERRLQQEYDCAETVEHLLDLVTLYGLEVVETAIIDVFFATVTERTGPEPVTHIPGDEPA